MVERTPPPEDFRNSEAVEAWLRGQPRDVSVAIAARAALRVLPAWENAFDRPDHAREWRRPNTGEVGKQRRPAVLPNGPARTLMLAIFRAVAASIVSSRREDFGGTIGFTAAAAAAAAERSIDQEANAARFAARCAAAAAGADAAAAVNWSDHAASHLGFGPANAAALRADATAGVAAPRPLWIGATPDSASHVWRKLRERLLAADEGWEVWADWYEARLRGDPFDPALEEARVLLPEALWEQGPKAVNTEIAKRMAAHSEGDAKEAAHSAHDEFEQANNPDAIEDLDRLLAAEAIADAPADFKIDEGRSRIRMVAGKADMPTPLDPLIDLDWRGRLAGA
ncbi:hypothetical protein SAMN05444370_1164 [Rubrimonas cliftonensis]|uniref:Uncharacterized protein n=2 Tax=Rubrimonas cliftonensis TaxID=89524 RepID=A0A1H4EVJ0_9RHOB|nr:hypothetical protein SAMN05444370_1164 [Rubrimonas cliftonensis]